MAKLHPDLNAMRSDAFTLEPERITLITDPTHSLYDPRVHDDPEESLVRNIMVYGVIEPIIIRNNGENVEVIAGRGRVKAALEANRRLTAEGKQPIRVPAILRRGQDADMFGVLISENECRREDNPLLKSVKAQRLIDMGKSVEEVAIAFGVSRQSVESWLALGDVAQPVLDAVEQGEISATAASKLSGLDREKQVETFEALKSEGGNVTVQRVKQAVREGDTAPPLPKMLSRKTIEYELQFVSRQHIEVNVQFYEGVKNALQWVLGLGCVWPATRGSASCGDEQAKAEAAKGVSESESGDEPDMKPIEVFAYGEWDPIHLPPDASLAMVSVQDREKTGWCKGCALAAFPHVMVPAATLGEYAKCCPLPLLERGILDFDRLLDSGGFDVGSDAYEAARALLNPPATRAAT